MHYRGHIHKNVYQKFLKSMNHAKMDRAALSAVFLLSADSRIWYQAKRQMDMGGLNFNELKIEGINPVQYTLLRAAQDLYEETQHISLADITDRDLVPEWMFRMLNDAITIRRFGVGARA